MHEAIRFMRRMIIRWQLRNLDERIQHILIARSHALSAVVELKQERHSKARTLENITSLGT